MKYYADKLDTKYGWIYAVVDEKDYVVFLYLDPKISPTLTDDYFDKKYESLIWDKRKCSNVISQMKEYFEGKRTKFNIKYRLEGTPFQMVVWNELTKIPYGKTSTYGDIAKGIGKPKASRAIGQANHNNPIMIIIPCHRCIGADGKIKGAKTAVNVRQQLLEHEGAM